MGPRVLRRFLDVIFTMVAGPLTRYEVPNSLAIDSGLRSITFPPLGYAMQSRCTSDAP